jgi:hypothetical protein
VQEHEPKELKQTPLLLQGTCEPFTAGQERKGSAQSAWQLLGFDQDGRSLTCKDNADSSRQQQQQQQPCKLCQLASKQDTLVAAT